MNTIYKILTIALTLGLASANVTAMENGNDNEINADKRPTTASHSFVPAPPAAPNTTAAQNQTRAANARQAIAVRICFICRQPINPNVNVAIPPCGHHFHFTCLTNQRGCPECRTTAQQSNNTDRDSTDSDADRQNSLNGILRRACQLGSIQAVGLLIRQGANVNAVGACGSTPLELAQRGLANAQSVVLRAAFEAIIRLLIAGGAQPTQRTNDTTQARA